ncbi:hypothetical protein ACF0H5_023301 [Mactra antiquata]
MNDSRLSFIGFVIALLCSRNVGSFELDEDVKTTEPTKKITAQFCPYMCTIGDAILCNPPPCPPPQCVDPGKYRPTDCCEYCLDGQKNCSSPDGAIINYQHWKIIDGKNCTCNFPGMDADCV